MKKTLREKWVRRFAGAVGAMDLATGLALMTAPAFTLARMGAVVPGSEALTYVRFSGAFVAAVGATYWWALGLGGVTRLRGALEFTALARLAAGGFSGIAVAAGLFDPAWLVVAATDLACAVLQVWMLTRGWENND